MMFSPTPSGNNFLKISTNPPGFPWVDSTGKPLIDAIVLEISKTEISKPEISKTFLVLC
jgi:hypothetical protein